MQGRERDALQEGDGVGAIRDQDIGARLDDVAIGYGLVEARIGESGERDRVALRAGAVDLEGPAAQRARTDGSRIATPRGRGVRDDDCEPDA
jgi:hypothetical protein